MRDELFLFDTIFSNSEPLDVTSDFIVQNNKRMLSVEVRLYETLKPVITAQ